MVRINLIDPVRLSDQHLIAEYNEILMLLGYVKKYPELKGIPEQYTLGEGHIKFFKDKLGHLADRHELIKQEMKARGFEPEKTISLDDFAPEHRGDFKPNGEDFLEIRKRLIEKIMKKSDFCRYYGEKQPQEFFKDLLK